MLPQQLDRDVLLLYLGHCETFLGSFPSRISAAKIFALETSSLGEFWFVHHAKWAAEEIICFHVNNDQQVEAQAPFQLLKTPVWHTRGAVVS